MCTGNHAVTRGVLGHIWAFKLTVFLDSELIWFHHDRIEIDTSISVTVVSLTTWEAHHSPRASPSGCGELPRSLMRQQWPQYWYQFLYYTTWTHFYYHIRAFYIKQYLRTYTVAIVITQPYMHRKQSRYAAHCPWIRPRYDVISVTTWVRSVL